MSTVIKTPPFAAACTTTNTVYSKAHGPPLCLSFRHRRQAAATGRSTLVVSGASTSLRRRRRSSRGFVGFASQGETDTEQAVQDPEIEDSSDGAIGVEDSAAAEEEQDGAVIAEDDVGAPETASSAVVAALQSYREALASEDESKIAEIETYLQSIEDEKSNLEDKLAALTADLSGERDRVLRISADFDNFRKRTQRERTSLVTNAQGEVVETLLGVLDNFERAKAQLKIETEGEEKINNSYQSIYKQFVEILGSLGVVPVETIGKPFDPMFHEAIMREESTEFEDGIILEEYRKGFKIGDRLLRPSMVKVSAGPGPAMPQQEATADETGRSSDDATSSDAESDDAGPDSNADGSSDGESA